jgi:hypothetical protein
LHAVCTYNPVMLFLAFASVIWLLSKQHRIDLRNTLATQHIIEPMIESRRLWLYPAVSQVSLPESGGMGSIALSGSLMLLPCAADKCFPIVFL